MRLMVDSRETVSTFCPASASLSMLTTCSSVTRLSRMSPSFARGRLAFQVAAFSGGGAGRLHRLRRRPSCSGPERGASLRVIPLLVPPRDHYLVSSGGRRGVIVPGMRVLDLGSGPRDVAFLAADAGRRHR